MSQLKRMVSVAFLVVGMCFAMMLATTQVAWAKTYNDGTIRLSELEAGDVISFEAEINESSGSKKDSIVLQAYGYLAYDGEYEIDEEADCGQDITLSFADYDDGYGSGWEYAISDVMFNYHKRSVDDGGTVNYETHFYGPFAAEMEVSSWLVVSIEGDEASGITATLAGYIGHSGTLTVGSNEDITFGDIGDYTYDFTPEASGTYEFYSEGDWDTWGILKDGTVTVAENRQIWFGNFSFTCELEAGKTYTFFAINDGDWASPPFQTTVVVEWDKGTQHTITAVGNNYVQVSTAKTAYRGEVVSVKAWIMRADYSYSPTAYVKKTSDGSLVQQVELTYNGQSFEGSFIMPDFDVTVEGAVQGAGDDDSEQGGGSVQPPENNESGQPSEGNNKEQPAQGNNASQPSAGNNNNNKAASAKIPSTGDAQSTAGWALMAGSAFVLAALAMRSKATKRE